MAEEVPAPQPEIDVDALDDKAFDELKGKIRREEPIEAPAKEPKTEPAAKTDDADDASDEPAVDANGKKQETVPHAKFHQANERRKAAEERANKAESDRVRALDRLQQLLEVRQPQQQEEQAEPVVPKWADDPMNAGEWTQQQIIELKQQLEGRDNEHRQRAQAEQQFNAMVSTATDQFEERATTDPTVRDAYEGLKASYAAELQALGYQGRQIEQELARIEAQGIAYALQNGINVADYVVNVAKARGWQPKAAPATETGKTEAEKITQREETRLASQSLGKSGGAVVNTGVITPEELLDMSDVDFEAYKKKHGSVAHAFRQAS